MSSKNPSNVNDAVTFTATVTASASGPINPTGTVTFTYNGSPIPDCTNPAPLISGVATCATQSLIAPSEVIQATYNGDNNFVTSNTH